jgi:hypothetical protein
MNASAPGGARGGVAGLSLMPGSPHPAIVFRFDASFSAPRISLPFSQ